jgi:hypothetical protein
MARRAGKAASRKARQRKPQRPPIPPRPAAAPHTDAIEEAVASAQAPSPQSPAPARAAVPPRALSARRGGRASMFATGASTLTDTERSEYHYVERDLRNIGILTAIMVGLLVLAWLVFSATGHVA